MKIYIKTNAFMFMRLATQGLIFILLTTSISSCDKLIEIDPPINQITDDQVYTNDNSATSVISSIYSQIATQTYLANSLPFIVGQSADELYYFSNSNSQFTNNTIGSTDPTIAGVWQYFYNTIYRCNSLLENLDRSTALSDTLKSRLAGEGKFLRAFCYFELVNLFGDVPLITSSDVNASSSAPRMIQPRIYEQIVDDLNSAKSLLPAKYQSTERVRANKAAATALLSRVYLYTKEWQKAEQEATTLISDTTYGPLQSLATVFLKNSKETILQLWNANGFTPIGSSTIPTTATPLIVFTDDFVNSIEAADARKTIWMKSILFNGKTYLYPNKYKQRTTTTTNQEYLSVLRLGEQYLIRAEARARQNNISDARDDLNVIRNRASLTNETTTNLDTLLLSIERERRIELAVEWGHRWFDLKRTNRADAVLGPLKGVNWQTTDQLYPIPASEILANGNLTPNPGY